jgi:Uma2 family endonuclease
MNVAANVPLLSVERYLREEAESSDRREYLGGYVYAMAGGKNVHNLIATNLLGILHAQLRGNPCAPYNSDTKLRIRHAGHIRFYYPDGMVVGTPNPPENPYQDFPAVIAEVLSPETRRIDEGEKREAYLSIPTVHAYLLIEADALRVHVYRRGDADFTLEAHEGLDAAVDLPNIAATLPLADLYERVTFSPTSGRSAT